MSSCQCCSSVKTVNFRFCPECGHDNSWKEGEFDQITQVEKYIDAYHSLYFDNENSEQAIEKYAIEIRKRLKISYYLHTELKSIFAELGNLIRPMMTLKIEVNENITDGFAGQDTHLAFRVLNPNDNNDRYNIKIEWLDVDSSESLRFTSSTTRLIKPGQCIEFGGTHIFMRAGPKEIKNMYMTVENQYFENYRFLISPFRIKVASTHNQVINNITTNTQISIEGRGVVDASNSGNISTSSDIEIKYKWKELFFIPVLDSDLIISKNKEKLSKYIKNYENSTSSNKNKKTNLVNEIENTQEKLYFSCISAYMPKSGDHKILNNKKEIKDYIITIKKIISNIKNSSYWHVLVGGEKTINKLMIREMLIEGENFNNSRQTSGDVLKRPQDYAALLTYFENENKNLFEIDALDVIFKSKSYIDEMFYTVIPDFQIDVTIGEGQAARNIKLDIAPFCSISYCNDINKLPINFVNLFDCVLNFE